MRLPQNAKNLVGLLVLTIATKSSILHATVFVDLLLVIEKIDQSFVLQFVLGNFKEIVHMS